ncbi:hypothetical protein PSTAB_0198 [Stutzerimonas stutzeri]|uniref:Uncharacterized protein n=1 Tax=Stutzerimonas stutzeri (strain ATCC 17588 / DSM 5190 / CCUG 11256 / JCM 5965 / LMG 11199 / NBRC 14165 / NCIMB 11358 / Stanier 221) TaxID=96563 RepID=F8H542_STUS2|nr:hypothetical protein PSTAB_0198 [Stutzerimonas stutzeri]AKN25090.1 hypothetical protein AB691_0168 [Stutzerimonas stutzeri]GBC54812.1 hypothetical protein PSNTI_02600 [Stutzerimonas stutzeri]
MLAVPAKGSHGQSPVGFRKRRLGDSPSASLLLLCRCGVLSRF